ncbi:amidohydrolase [Oceanobacillus kimchii]|uniref:Aminobenzoyl-glutamate utilization protein A n=1 Tax=Oceanobacillus kimchii TaxID=746691 RepID=A0ABQ5THS3_9BACI|nr:amidohydrolase [Oceanobacillus kimchii]GLO65173.1 aminobenzoyl-glutamate utilization protein A [Oceanobacillus kimchii]
MSGGFTGIVARLDTGKPGKHFALRFDIDALPIEESTNVAHLPVQKNFRSQNDGMMHACGHDGHTAIGLGIAHLLHEHQRFLNGSFTLLFQPAEEGCRGANALVQKGWLEHVDYFLSGHIGIHDFPVGTIGSLVTDILATTKIDVDLIGKTAHASIRPHEGKNALLAGTALVQALHSIAPHGDGMTRLNVGKFSAGTGRNIVPGKASLQLETRGASTKENNYMKKEVFKKIDGVAKMYGVEAIYSIVGEGISTTSDPCWHNVIIDASQSSDFVTNVLKEVPFNASEDVTFMMKHVQETGGKSVFMIYGTPLVEGHHHCAFDFNERTLSVALSALIEVIWQLNEKANL